MARRTRRPPAARQHRLEPAQRCCPACGGAAPVAHHSRRTVVTLDGLVHLTLVVRRCRNGACALYKRAYRPEEEGRWARPQAEVGLDVVALVGALRYGEHRSVPEIHAALAARGVAVAERTVTHLVRRYEELVALRLADRHRLRERLAEQGRVVLAVDGLQPDVGHEVLWVLRDCLSGEVLLARSLLGATEKELVPLLREVVDALPVPLLREVVDALPVPLLREVVDALPVPVAGVISDGQHSLRNAVASALPGVPHQLCQFHYLREAAKPVYEADRHAKTLLKTAVRGVRPIERALERRDDAEAAAVRGDCLAVRSALTDDGRAPLCASGLKLRDRLGAVADSLDRVLAKRQPPGELARLRRLLGSGLAATAGHGPALRTAYGWVHEAARLLDNSTGRPAEDVRLDDRALLATMAAGRGTLGALAPAVDQFLRVTDSYWPGLFHCYEVPDLPRTNNDLEHFFGAARYRERRATGRRMASPGIVVRGAVRLVTAVAVGADALGPDQIRPVDPAAWRALRRQLDDRHDARRAQLRFRRAPDAYLAALEDRLLKPTLPP
jgi:hypothetical protein